MIRTLASLPLLLALSATTDPLAGRVAGAAQRCISVSPNNLDGPQIVDQRTILYRRGATIYRTTVEKCPSLRPLTTLITEVYGGRLCRNDRFRTIEPGMAVASPYCFLGDFTPFTRVRGRSD